MTPTVTAGAGDNTEPAEPVNNPDNTRPVLSGNTEAADNTPDPDNSLLSTLKGLFKGGGLEEVTEKEEEYGIQVQGSDRRYPAVILRRKHRGKGATIKTISKTGAYAAEYEQYREVIEAYQRRRSNGGRHVQDDVKHSGSEREGAAVQNLE